MITSLSVFVFNLEAEEEKEEIISIIFNSQESIYLTYLSTWKKRNATKNRVIIEFFNNNNNNEKTFRVQQFLISTNDEKINDKNKHIYKTQLIQKNRS